MNLLGMALTKPILIGAGLLVAALLAVIGVQGVLLKLKGAELERERDRYAALAEKNGRCEGEAASLKAAIADQNAQVQQWEAAAKAAQEISGKALNAAAKARVDVDRRIREIQKRGPIDPTNICKSAIHELREGAKR